MFRCSYCACSKFHLAFRGCTKAAFTCRSVHEQSFIISGDRERFWCCFGGLSATTTRSDQGSYVLVPLPTEMSHLQMRSQWSIHQLTRKFQQNQPSSPTSSVRVFNLKFSLRNVAGVEGWDGSSVQTAERARPGVEAAEAQTGAGEKPPQRRRWETKRERDRQTVWDRRARERERCCVYWDIWSGQSVLPSQYR